MSSIDQRTVKMSFDNAAFERGVQTTLGTLEKLKQSLNFTGAAQGMDGIRDAASRISFESLAENVQSLQDRFSVLGEFVHNVFMDIVNSAFDAGKKLVDALALEPLKEGFREYELQMNSVQTIMASTGESVDVVNGYLDELNNYADKTIYSFSDMTQNIGKFTNAGVKLDDAVAAIQGVSNVAAVSGANANEASRAMYNFAQALSAGYVKLIDWKSIEVANMATVEFKQALLDTALAMGTVVKEGDDYISTTTNAKGEISEAFNATKNFNEMLQYQWMSTEVLTQTLQNYSTDVREMNDAEKQAYREKLRGLGYTEEQITKFEELGMKAADAAKDVKTFSQLIDTVKESLGSSWTRSWQLVIGDLEEAKKLWTRVNDIISGYVAKSAEARNATIKAWVDNGGRTAAIDGLIDAFEALVDRLRIIKNVFTNVFPPKTGEQIAEITKKFAAFTKGLRLSKDQTTLFQNQLQLVFSAVKPLITVFHNVIDTVVMFFKAISDSIKYDSEWVAILRNIVSAIYAFSNALKPTMAVVSYFNAIVKDVLGLVNDVAKGFAKFGTAVLTHVVQGFKELLPYSNDVATILSSLHTRLTTARKAAGDFFNYLNNNSHKEFTPLFLVSSTILHIAQGIANMGKIAFNVFSTIAKSVASTFDLQRFLEIVLGLSLRFHRLSEVLIPSKELLEGISSITRGLVAIIQSAITVVDRFGSALFDRLIQPIENSENKFGNLTSLLKDVGGFLGNLSQQMDNTLTYSFFSEVIDNVTTALKNFADAINGLVHFDELIDNFKAFYKETNDNKESSTILSMVADALKKFSDKLREVSDSLKNFAIGLGNMLKLDNIINSIKNFFDGLWSYLQSIDVLRIALELINKLSELANHLISKLDFSDPEKAMKTVSALFGVLTGGTIYNGVKNFFDSVEKATSSSSSLFDKLKNSIKSATKDITESLKKISDTLVDTLSALQNTINANAILKIAIAVAILAISLNALSDLELEKILPNLGVLSTLLAELFAVLQMFNKLTMFDAMKNGKLATAMMEIAGSVLILAIALKTIAVLDPDQLSRGLLSISILLWEMEAVAKKLASAKGDIAGGAGTLIKLAAAVVILVQAVKSLADVNPDRLVPAMVAFSVIMAELGAVAWALSDLKIIEDPLVLTDVAKGLIIFVVAVKLLASCVKSLGRLEPDQLIAGTSAVSALMLVLVAAAVALTDKKLVDMPYQLTSLSKALLIFVAAVKILSTIVLKFAELNPDQLIQGVVGMGAVMAGLVVAAIMLTDKQFIDMPYSLEKVSKSLLIFVACVAILSKVVVTFAQIPIDKLVTGLIGLAVVMAAIVLSAGKLSGMDLTGLNNAALGMMAFVGCVKTMSDSALKMAAIPFDKLVGGLGGLIVVTALLVGVSEILSKKTLDPVRIAAVSAALIVFGVAVALFSASVAMLAAVGWDGVAVGLVAIAAAFGILFVATLWLQGMLPQMAALATVMLEFSASAALFGIGIGVAAAGIGLLVAAVAAGGFTVIEVLRQLIGLLPELAGKFAEAIARFLTVIGENGPQIQEGLRQLFEIIVLAIAENGMLIINAVLEFITQFLESLAEYVPRMAEAGLAIIDGLLSAIANHIGSITEAACTIVIEFIRGITEKLPEIVDTAFKMVIAFINGLADAIRNNHDQLWDAVGNLISAIVEALLDGVNKLLDAIADLLADMVKAIGDGVGDFLEAGKNLVWGFIDGIKSLGTEIWNAGCNLVDTAWKAITGAAQEHSPSRLTFGGGVNFVLGFINGMKDQLGPTGTAAAQIAYTAWDALQNGMSPDVTFAPNIKPFMDLGFVDEMAQNVADTASQAMYGAQEIIRSGLSTDMSFAPTITPVMDLSFIEQLKSWITDTASRVAYTAWTALQEGLSSDMNFAPTITPVMDLSDIQNGIVTAKDLMYSMPDTVGISASISNDKNLKRQMVDLMSSQNDYSSILAGMSDLRSELSSFGDKLAQMQIVMDSGALVGAIAQPMDQTLGMRQAMVGRGVL